MVPKGKTFGGILLADDGSAHARAAVDLVCNLPLPPQCHVTVLRVFGSQQAGELGLLEEALASTCAQLKEQGFQVDSELLLGSPAEVITQYAEEHKMDLIVVGAKGLRATLGILLGGVAQQVVEYAAHPVLVVRAPYVPIERVLFLTDGSPYSEWAAEFLGEFPLPMKIDVRVMHVLPPPPVQTFIYAPSGEPVLYEPPVISEAVTAEQAREEEAGHELLLCATRILGNYGIKSIPILKRGDAATEIIDYIKEHKINLTVSGSRGLGQMRSWLMGSVSRKLVHYSGCSVLVVRGPKAD
jgi:nucleotide-binding universal stress UspA family protein